MRRGKCQTNQEGLAQGSGSPTQARGSRLIQRTQPQLSRRFWMKSCTRPMPTPRMRCRHGCCLRSVASLPAIVSCSKQQSVQETSAANLFGLAVHAGQMLTCLRPMQQWTFSTSLQSCVMFSSLVYSQWTHEALEPPGSRFVGGSAV